MTDPSEQMIRDMRETKIDGDVTIADLLRASANDPVFFRAAALLQNRRGPSRVNITGMPESMKAYLISSFCEKLKRPAVILVSDELVARRFRNDLSAFSEKEVLVLRQREQNLTEVDASSRETELGRIRTLRRLIDGDYSAVIVTAGAMSDRLMPAGDFRKAEITLTQNMRVSPEDLAMRLSGNGYERVRSVEGEGEFSRRGDILDVFPVGSERPIRLSFFDDEIDGIKSFDMESQRSIEILRTIRLDIAREILVPDSRRAAIAREIAEAGEKARAQAFSRSAPRDVCDRLLSLAQRDAEHVSEGVLFSGLERWIRLIYRKNDTALGYAKNGGALIFVDELIQIRKRSDAHLADFAQRFSSLLEKGQILPVSEDILLRGPELMIEIDRAEEAIALSTLPTSGNGLPGGERFEITGRACDSFRGHEEHLAKLIIERRHERKQTYIMAGEGARADKLKAFLFEREAFAPILRMTLPAGFEYPGAGILIAGTQDIFGIDRPVRRRQIEGVRIDLFSDLVPGELVVHDIHGIGRYDGIINLQSGTTRRDYLKISYASDDTLYIPMESLSTIQKYVGTEGRTPKLSRLGGQDWNRMKERARGSIRKLAIDLVELYARRRELKGYAFSPDSPWQIQFEEDFPYSETRDQINAIREIKKDMESDGIMDRLLCGDVGFGKTEVAFRAIFKCVMDGKQAVMLAPTTVLVQQHYENLKGRLEGYPVNIGLLSRFAHPSEIKRTLSGLCDGTVDVVVGTHRLLSKDVVPKDLGLLVVDEEQRFGVEHKERIKALRSTVDVLTLTATPIPRTLQMSLSGIRDISVIEEPPLDRRPVQTYVLEYDPDILTDACLREISRGGQVFYLFNDTHRIEEKIIELEKALPGARIVMGHGKMAERELERVIENFIRHEADILVCTTIIESGIDMPNVNTLIVENADRFGLAQLYQLRGRVGRSDRQAYAYITYRRDKVLTEEAEKRLAAIRDFTELGSGFKIALKDLEVRGAGNLLGSEQHGQMDVIGYELYCRMLDEEVRELQGIETTRPKDATVDIEIDAYLPPDYISDEGQRMDAYRRIAGISSFGEYKDVLEEMADRYGSPPQEAMVLTDIAYVRHMAARYDFSRITVKDGTALLYYSEHARPDMEALSRVLAHRNFAGRIMLSAVSRPYVRYSAENRASQNVALQLRYFFMLMEGMEIIDEDH